jgi:hypothetical protein
MKRCAIYKVYGQLQQKQTKTNKKKKTFEGTQLHRTTHPSCPSHCFQTACIVAMNPSEEKIVQTPNIPSDGQ